MIAKPLLGASTAEIYRAYDRSPTPRTDSDGVIKALTQGSFTDLCSSIGNALAKACASVTGIDPPTEALLRTLGAEGASLSGSGTAAFGLFSNARAARIAAGKLRQSGFSVCLASPQA